MKLPNGQLAVVDVAKLSDYCLSATHLRGRHKARVFASALSMYETDAPALREVLLLSARTEDAEISASDKHGTRYIIDTTVRHKDKSADIRSIWIIRSGEEVPRFVTCYALSREGQNV